MLYFGGEKFRPDVERAPVPVGIPCNWCDEHFEIEDDGFTFPVLYGEGKEEHLHRPCFMRRLLGSVGHQMDLCSCKGGRMEDPPGFTLRQSAILATALGAFLAASQ